MTINGPTAVLDLGNNQNGYVGTVMLDGGGSIIGTGASHLTSRSSFQLKSGSVSAILAGPGIPLVKATSGTVTLSAANTYSGGTTISGGVLNINADAAFGAVPTAPANNVTFSGNGVLQTAAGMTLSGNRGVVISGGASGGVDTNGNAVNIAGSLSNSGTFSKQGAGALEIRGATTSANGAAWQVNAGTLRFNSVGPASVGSGVSATVSTGGTLQLSGTVSALANSDGSDAASIVTHGSGTLLIAGGTGPHPVSNQTVGSVSGDSSVSGGATVYSGNTTVGDGNNAANLTATQILQNSLTINAGSTVTIAPSDPPGNGNAVPAASNTSASSSPATAAASDSSGSDPFTAIQAAIASGAIGSTTGQVLENRIAAIERLAATDPGLDVSLLESRVLAVLPAVSLSNPPSPSLTADSSPTVDGGSSLLALDSSALGSSSASGARAAFAPARASPAARRRFPNRRHCGSPRWRASD